MSRMLAKEMLLKRKGVQELNVGKFRKTSKKIF